MGKLSRSKGKVWEREVANLLKPIFGDQVKRGLAQARFGAAEEPDVKNVPRFWVECKHGKQVNVRAALRQAIDALAASLDGQPTDRWPVAMVKDHQDKPGTAANTMAVLRLDDFLALIAEWWLIRGALQEASVAHLSKRVELPPELHGLIVNALAGLPMPEAP